MSGITHKSRRFGSSDRGLLAARCLGQHPDDIRLDGADICLDVREGARRCVAVEVPVEVDLVADDSDFLVLLVTLGGVDPGIGLSIFSGCRSTFLKRSRT